MDRDQTIDTNARCYYSVDRRGRYKVGCALQLLSDSPPEGKQLSDGDFVRADELRAHIHELFPEGLSLHGWDYVTRSPLTPDGKCVIYSTALEIFVEYVRRASFPALPSRLQSYFAFDNLEDTKDFAAANGQKPIYRLRADRVLRFDQNWLRLGWQSAYSSFAARSYWSGSSTPEPKWEYLLVPPVDVVELILC